MTSGPDNLNSPEDASPQGFGTDLLIQGVLGANDVRIVVVDASATAFEAEFRHLSGRIASEIAARAAVGVALMSVDLKDDERLSIQLLDAGPIGGFLIECNAKMEIRGYTRKKVLADLDSTSTPFAAAVGATGRLAIVSSTGDRVVYQGVTQLADGDIASDLERALRESRQIPSLLRIDHGYARQLTHAVGFLVQALPGFDPERFNSLAAAIAERADAVRPFPRDPRRLLATLIPEGIECRILAERPVRFGCHCSRQRALDILKSLGPPDDGSGWAPVSRVTCAFCNDSFEIPAEELSS